MDVMEKAPQQKRGRWGKGEAHKKQNIEFEILGIYAYKQPSVVL